MAKFATIRPLVMLAMGGFVSMASLRVSDPLIPQIAAEFDASLSAASVIATMFSLGYGLSQLVFGQLGDRFGKYGLVTLCSAVSGVAACAAAWSPSLQVLAALRLVNGATAGAMIPLALAYIGDVIPYQSRQTVLGRFLTGTLLGMIFGQVAGGALGDHAGWRTIFLLIGALFLLVSLLLWSELRSGRVSRTAPHPSGSGIGLYAVLLRIPRVRVVLAAVAVESLLFHGSFVYLGAYLKHAFDVGYSTMGAVLGCFGLGGLLYAALVRSLVGRLGEQGLVLAGGALLCAALLGLAVIPAWWLAAPLMAVIGLGFYMLHNTLQVNASEMAPHNRGLALSSFAAAIFLSQAVGIPIFGHAIELVGYPPVLSLSGFGLLALGALLRPRLARQQR